MRGSIGVLVAGISLLAAAAWAVLPPEAYEEARRNATWHVQVAIDKVDVPAKTPGTCEVHGKVVRIFRDKTGKLKKGATWTLGVSCRKPGDDIPDGPVKWKSVAAVKGAKVIEAFANPTKNEVPRIARWQSQLLKAATDKPVMKVKAKKPKKK